MHLSFSTALDPSVSLYVVDNTGARITSIDSNYWFFPVQRGLPAGTLYTFRLLEKDGNVVVPANENFTALPMADEPKYQIGVEQYHYFSPGKYTLELVKIEGTRGIIVARTSIRVTSQQATSQEDNSLMLQNCSEYLPPFNTTYPSMNSPEAPYLSHCIEELAVANNNPELCKSAIPYFENGIWVSDGCLEIYAVNKSDLSLCEKRERAVDKALCRAKILGSISECTSFPCDFYWSCDDQKDVCLVNLGLMKQNASICSMANSIDYRSRCLALVLSDSTYCKQIIDNQSRVACLNDVS